MVVTLYELLSVRWNAPESEIRQAIDRAEADGSIDAQILETIRQVLLDPEARRQYNRRLAAHPVPNDENVEALPQAHVLDEEEYEEDIGNESFPWMARLGSPKRQVVATACVALIVGLLAGYLLAPSDDEAIQAHRTENDALRTQLRIRQAELNILKAQQVNTAETTGNTSSPPAAPVSPVTVSPPPPQPVPEPSADGPQSVPQTNTGPSLESQAKSIVADMLTDPGSAQFKIFKSASNIPVPGSSGTTTNVVCGTVNAKNPSGAYTGAKMFVWTNHDNHVGLKTGLGVDQQNDANVDMLWTRYCR